MYTPVSAQEAEHLKCEEPENECEQSSSATLDMKGLFLVSNEDSVVASVTGPTANLVCLCSLWLPNQLLERHGLPRVSTYPSQAGPRFRDGRLGEVLRAAQIPRGSLGPRASSLRLCCMQLLQRH